MIIVRVTLRSKDDIQVIKNVKVDNYTRTKYIVTDLDGNDFEFKRSDLLSISAEDTEKDKSK